MRFRQVIAGLGWTATATLVNVAAQLTFVAILARKLEPAAFGMLAMASVATRFASYFAQMGGAQTLIQAPELTPGMTSAALGITLAVSAVLYGALLVAAPLFGLYFQSPELVHVLWVFGLSLPLTAAGALPMALLRRQARFRATSTIEVLGYVLGYGLTGVTLASLGYGFWSLVSAVLMQQLVVLALAFSVVRFPLDWPVPRQAWNRILGTGSRYSILGFMEFLWSNSEVLVIGRALGQSSLGLFNRAQQLCSLPIEQAVTATNKVVFPALSAMHRERGHVKDGFLVMLLATGIASAALSSGISAAAPDLVAALLGPKWGDAVPMVQVLAAAVAATFVYVVCGITLDSMAALRPKLRLQSALLLIKAVILLLLVRWGMTGMVVAIVACELLRTALGLALLTRILEIDSRDVWIALLVTLAVAGSVYGAVSAARLGASGAEFGLGARLFCQAVAGALMLVAVLCVLLHRWTQFAPLHRFESIRKSLRIAHDFVYGRSRT